MLLEPIPDMESKMDATLVNMTKGVAYVRISNTDTLLSNWIRVPRSVRLLQS